LNLMAKERRGVELVITKIDGQQIQGELIAIRQNSLLLLSYEGADVSVYIDDIEVITIEKKSKAWIGGGVGLLIGSSAFLIIAYNMPDAVDVSVPEAIAVSLLLGMPVALLGALIGSTMGGDETIQIEGISDTEKKEVLEKLRRQARIINAQ